MTLYFKIVIYCLLLGLSATVKSKDTLIKSDINFTHYSAEITPDFKNKSIDGVVEITFISHIKGINYLSFSAKFKQIQSIYFSAQKLDFSIEGELLKIQLPTDLTANKYYSITIKYKATPTRGMKFYDDHLFTVYHTKNWLPSHSNISNKATVDLYIKHDEKLTSVGNGNLVSRKNIDNSQVVSHWQQRTPIPLYTFGFALGYFETLSVGTGSIDISVLYRQSKKSDLSAVSIKKAFKNVADMLSFFESKAGFRLEDNYSYVVVDGYMAQEASSFSLVGEKYVHTLLKEKNENWFIAHELAHEWWGNSITSANFSHFWLNEGLVTFLVATYKQHLFGEEAYKSEIKVAVNRVLHAVKEKRIAPVAFSKVIEEQNINRTMTYSKGALIFYMLREQLGDKLFWQSLKQYSLTYKGQSVTTQNLKSVFEQATDKDLTPFFNRWVYGQEIPTLDL